MAPCRIRGKTAEGGVEDKGGGKWMEQAQSKFVIVKQMKEPRFCGGVNIELANLWTLTLALLTASVTLSPMRFCLLGSHRL